MSAGNLLAAIGQAGRGFQQDRRKRQQEEATLERLLQDRTMQQEDRQRKRTLEDALLARQEEEHQYRVSQRPLDEEFRRAQIESMRQRTAMQGQPKPRNMPASAIEKNIGLDNMLGEAENVQRTLESAIANKTDVSGRVGGVVKTPTWWKNADLSWIGMGPKGGQEGVRARQVINSLKGQIAKERAGTAMSPSELDLLESYIPSDNDDETTALNKTKEFVRALNEIKGNRQKAYSQYGMGFGAQPPQEDERLPFEEYD